MARRSGAKAFARHDGDLVFIQQTFSKAVAIQPGRADVQHHVHRPLGRHGAHGVLPGQQVQRNGAAAAEGGCDLCLEIGPQRQGKQCCVLNIAGNAVIGVGRQIDQMGDDLFGGDDPAQTAAGHGMGFRHGPDHQRPVGHAGQGAGGQVFALPYLGVIDLVRDQPQVVILYHAGDALKRVARIDHPGGVVGRIDQQAFGALGQCGDGAGIGLKPVLGAGGNRHRHGAIGPDRAGIGGITRINIQRPVAGIANRVMGGIQRRLSACGDQHIRRAGWHPGLILHPFGHRVTQGRNAGDQRVSRGPVQGGLVHVVQDQRIGANVMFADGQLGDVMALGFQLSGAVKQAPTV